MSAKRALVTGASRGIGKAIALALAEQGFDVAVSGRTLHPGQVHDNGPGKASEIPLPGSLAETVVAIERSGTRGLALPMDLTDRGSVGAAGQLLLERWGGVDLLVHSGRHIGKGLMDSFLDLVPRDYDPFYEAHCIAPIILTRQFLPGMLERGAGQIVTITSGACMNVPPACPGKGGWGMGYSVGKASGHMLAGALHAEFYDDGILSFNVDPGAVLTERKVATATNYGINQNSNMASPETIGVAVAWLVTTKEGAALSGQTIDGQALARERGLARKSACA